MKLWLIDRIIEGCYPVWEEIDTSTDTDYASKIREEYADALVDAGLIEAVSHAIRVVYRRTELGELLLSISDKKAFNQYMELNEVLDILNNWDDLWKAYEDKSDEKEADSIVIQLKK